MTAERWTDDEARRYARVTRGDDEETVRVNIRDWFVDVYGWPLYRRQEVAREYFTRRVIEYRTKGDDR